MFYRLTSFRISTHRRRITLILIEFNRKAKFLLLGLGQITTRSCYVLFDNQISRFQSICHRRRCTSITKHLMYTLFVFRTIILDQKIINLWLIITFRLRLAHLKFRSGWNICHHNLLINPNLFLYLSTSIINLISS